MHANRQQRDPAALFRLAENALCEDAPEIGATAREQLLRMYRVGFNKACRLNPDLRSERSIGVLKSQDEQAEVPWGDTDNQGLAWICVLAEAGHAGAARLADRLLNDSRFQSLHLEDSEDFQALGKRFPRVARHFVRTAAEAKDSDPAAAVAWLERAGGECALIATTLQGIGNWRTRWKTLSVHVANAASRRESRAIKAGDLLLGCFQVLLAPEDALDARDRRLILSNAALHGSTVGAALLLKLDLEEAEDKAAFLRSRFQGDDPLAPMADSWLWRDELRALNKSLAAACFEVALDEEKRDLRESATWYWRGLSADWRSAHTFSLTAAQARALDGDFCYYVARRLDPRVHDLSKDPIHAVRWYVRGLERGNAGCLNAWVSASLLSGLGLSPDPVSALDIAGRWLASRSTASAAGCCKDIQHLAGKMSDPALAAAWLRVAQRLAGG